MYLLKKKALVLLSGGQDSTTCLYWAKREFNEVRAVSIVYGQRHGVEIESAKIIARMANVEHEVIVLPDGILMGASPLVNSQEEVGQYESSADMPKGVDPTFVPSRNIVFLSIASNRAVVHECDNMIIGVSQEDYGGYPDCREHFISSFEKALNSGLFGITSTKYNLRILTPLMFKDKAHTVLLAVSLGSECMRALGHSHTCYKGEFPPCGKCHACLIRARGFDRVRIEDPLIIRARSETR